MKGKDMVQSVASRLLLAARTRCGPSNLLERLAHLAHEGREVVVAVQQCQEARDVGH